MAGMKGIIALMMMGVLATVPMTALAGELTAGDVDDNLQFDYYLEYLAHVLQDNRKLPKLTVNDRVIIKVVDQDGLPVSHARVCVTAEGASSPLIESYTNTAGIFYFFPEHDGAGAATCFTATVRPPVSDSVNASVKFDTGQLDAKRTVPVRIPGYGTEQPLSLDIVFTIDVTGSMTDELGYITKEFRGIISDIAAGFPNVSMRFGLVVYRDHGDQLVVKSYTFTESLQTMQDQLAAQKATGGGDYEEAVDEALDAAVAFPWRGGNTVRMVFHVGDAPPHDDLLAATLEQVEDARRQGVQMFTLSGSGVMDVAEYMMRAEALLTTGRYCFLTDDSGIGEGHAKPHIECYVVTLLDDLVYRIVATELAGYRVEPGPNQIIRTVGDYHNGTSGDAGEAGGNATSGGTSSGGSSSGASSPPPSTVAGGEVSSGATASPSSGEHASFSSGRSESPSLTATDGGERYSSSSEGAPKPAASGGAYMPGMNGTLAGAAVALIVGIKLLEVAFVPFRMRGGKKEEPEAAPKEETKAQAKAAARKDEE
jgi:hypothetical protein